MSDLPYSSAKAPVPFVSQVIKRSLQIDFGCLGIGIVKLPPPKTHNETYAELSCTEQDLIKIHELIKTMAENGKFSLLFMQTYLRQLGTQVNHVHPLKFLGVVFANPDLRIGMKEIFRDSFKRAGFLDGLAPCLSLEMEKGKLVQYIEDFSNEVGASADGIRPYFQASDWEALLRHLIGE